MQIKLQSIDLLLAARCMVIQAAAMTVLGPACASSALRGVRLAGRW
ncbi:hypothetical protein ACDH70_18275 [Xanthomonas axonopodis pv. poinsettiicola]|nr:hypothetical protein [Xanthomonas codiaei]